MTFSVGSWSFHHLFESGRMNLFGYLQSIKYRYHLSSADIWNGMMVSTDDDYIQSIRNTIVDEELTLANLAVDGAPVWDNDDERRTQSYHKALQYLNIARELGARTLRIDLGGNSEEMTEEQFEFSVNRYKEYAQFAYDNGFKVGPQTHSPSAQNPHNIKRLALAVNSQAFGAVVDVGRWTVDKVNGDEICAPHTMHVHFDSSRTMTRETLEQQVRMYIAHGYQGCWSLEYRLGGDEYLGVAADLSELRRAVYLAEH